MEVPNSYKFSDIDKHVLNKPKTELLKANINFTLKMVRYEEVIKEEYEELKTI